MLRKIFNINLFLFLLSTALSLLFAEFLVRTFFPEYVIWNYSLPLEKNGFRLLGHPNSTFVQKDQHKDFHVKVFLNQYGFRDKNDLKDSRKRDAVILGDSFCFGNGVEEEKRFGNVLQKMMSDSFNVYNIGIPSCHFLNYKSNLEYAKKLGLQTQKMILGVCMENDLKEYDKMKLDKESVWRNIKKWFNNNSALYAFVGQKIHSSEVIENILSGLGLMNDHTLPSMYAVSDAAIKSSADELEKITKDYDALIVIIPSRLVWIEKHQAKANEIHQKFIQKLKDKSLKVLDMKSVFDSVSQHPLEDFHFEHDGHWNTKGHQLVAKAIYEQLTF
ncbi:MAG TPA: hypothetical protein ENJ53_00405 [Phaeodactylibacter sp.]|nr:hypothetical protein [Phaeodactylibacter sp.]